MLESRDAYLLSYPPLWIGEAAEQLLPSTPGGRTWRMPPSRMHTTVQKLGSYLPDGRLPSWLLALRNKLDPRSFGPPFDISMDVLRSRDLQAVETTVELTGRGVGVSGMRRLCRNLADALKRADVPVTLIRREMIPHVTLDYRHPPVPERRIAPLTWRVDEVCLVISYNGQSRHEVLARWQLVETQQALFV